jgi:hypothetical protein
MGCALHRVSAVDDGYLRRAGCCWLQPPAGHGFLYWPGILESLGIFAVSVSGHSSLPVLRSSMRNPQVSPPSIITPCAVSTVIGMQGMAQVAM